MARKTKEIMINAGTTIRGADNRDVGRTFLLTELPASRAEKWATRAWLAIAHAGKEVPPYVAQAGMVGFALYTFAALAEARYEELEPLLDEMMDCVQIVMPTMTRKLVEEDIEEVETRSFLRLEVLYLHTGFTFSEWASKHAPAPKTKKRKSSSTTPTSPA